MGCDIRIGTSGWYYRHWLGDFYPAEMKLSQAFAHYAKHFNTVEINNSFYALPAEKTVIKWKESSPPDFVFAVKGSRYLTHIKKLKDPEEALSRFFGVMDHLDHKFGPILFQFPGNWNFDYQRLATFLSALPVAKRYVFEFRAGSWFTQPVYDLLRKHNSAFCLYDRGGVESPLEITADFTYIRMHGAAAQWNGSYERSLLLPWAERIAAWRNNLSAVYCYFNNDFGGHAIRNAKELTDLIH
jgi:uncharacterized protein YecE (DUF72 family)